MASLDIHLDIDEIVKKLKEQGWIIPVHCKDCKYWWDEEFCCCRGHGFSSREFYCADGERRAEDDQLCGT